MAKAQAGWFHGLCTSKDLIPGTAMHIAFQRAQSYGRGNRMVSMKCLRKALAVFALNPNTHSFVLALSTVENWVFKP